MVFEYQRAVAKDTAKKRQEHADKQALLDAARREREVSMRTWDQPMTPAAELCRRRLRSVAKGIRTWNGLRMVDVWLLIIGPQPQDASDCVVLVPHSDCVVLMRCSDSVVLMRCSDCVVIMRRSDCVVLVPHSGPLHGFNHATAWSQLWLVILRVWHLELPPLGASDSDPHLPLACDPLESICLALQHSTAVALPSWAAVMHAGAASRECGADGAHPAPSTASAEAGGRHRGAGATEGPAPQAGLEAHAWRVRRCKGTGRGLSRH